MAAAALACLTGCWTWSAPEPDGPATPEPVETSATPFEDEALALGAEHCGTSESEPPGDAGFTGEASWPGALLPNGMTVPLGLTIDLESSHGSHTVDLNRTSGVVTDGAGTVVGLVTGVATPPGSGDSGPGPAYSAPIVVSVGACAAVDVALADPLPDGEYELAIFGPISPDDHDHGQQEYWVAAPLPFSVTGGEISLGTS